MGKYRFLPLVIIGLVACGDDGTVPTDGGPSDSRVADSSVVDSEAPDSGISDSSAGDSGSVDGGMGDTGLPPGCAPSLTDCGGACVDTTTDPAHCGGCDMPCAAAEVCAASACHEVTICDPPGAPGASGVTVSAVSGDAEEGGSAVTYSVVLDAEPCTDVLITLAGDSQVAPSPPSQTFTAADWNTPQTVWVTAVHDFDIEGDHTGTVTHTAASGDSSYGGIAIDGATINVLDRAHLKHVSVSMTGTGANGESSWPNVSNNGQWVSFVSAAANLVAGDTAGHDDVFLRDLGGGVTARITVGTAGEADGDSYDARISADGSSIALHSAASNLLASPTPTSEVYRWHTVDGVTQVTSLCSGCTGFINSYAFASDGSHLSYSTARAMLPADTDADLDVYTARLVDGMLTLDSLNSADENATPASTSPGSILPTISSSGRHVGFTSRDQNLDTPEITISASHPYVKDNNLRTATRVSRDDGGNDTCEASWGGGDTPFASTDGNTVVFRSACAITLAAGELPKTTTNSDIFVRDIAAMTTTRIVLAHDGTEPNGDSTPLAITDDARYVLFGSEATNIVPGDTNGAYDLFIHDRTAGTSVLVSYDAAYGPLASGAVEENAHISASGDYVVFATVDNLLPSDDNVGRADIYRVRLR